MQLSNEMEIWKEIEGFKGEYQISSLGRVKSFPIPRKKGKSNKIHVLKGSINNNGYVQYNLSRKKYLGHRLVATHFLTNPSNYPLVNHKDTNPKNNQVSNLEWCDSSYNQQYSIKRFGDTNYRCSISSERVLDVLVMSKTNTPAEISKRLNISYSVVYKILCGHAWNHLTGLKKVRFYKLKTAS